MKTSWFLIVNPTAGNGSFKKNWLQIQTELKQQNIDYTAAFTKNSGHEIILVQEAVTAGYTKIISVGGDGTLHHVVNGIMLQKTIPSIEITIGVIPLGTGNDWVKTYAIPQNIKQNIQLIKQENTVYQDVGCVELTNKKRTYFTNVAGVGYDGYVVNTLNKLKRFGPVAYLVSGLAGLLFYKKTSFKITNTTTTKTVKSLMTLVGICKYSGGGMQLTSYIDATNGLFDISVVKDMTFLELFLNIKKLYNGAITTHKKVNTYTSPYLKVSPLYPEEAPFIQADGELIGKGTATFSILQKQLCFVVNPFF